MSADERRRSHDGADTSQDTDAMRQESERDERAAASEKAQLPEPLKDVARTATDMVPGIPVGSGEGIDNALEQPDTDLGGGVAGDTRVGSETPQKPDREAIRRDDNDRTTL